MPARLDDAKRAAILADIDAGTHAARAIAKKHGVSQSTVSKLAKDNGKHGAFDRTKTAHATRAKQADAAELRVSLALRNLARAHRIHDRLDAGTFETKHVAADGRVITVRTDDPAPLDEKNLAASVASYANAADRLAPPTTGNADDVTSMLGRLGDALTRAANTDEGGAADEEG